MDDFMEKAKKLNFLVAIQLEKLDWQKRVACLWYLIGQNAGSSSHQERQYDDFRKTADDQMSSLIELYFEAVSWEKLHSFYERQGHRWKVRREANHKELKTAQDQVPEIQSQKAVEVFNLLPVVGLDNHEAEVLVYEKSRLVLLNKIVEVWGTTDWQELAGGLFKFVIGVLRVNSKLGRYGSRAVQALKDKTAFVSANRLAEGLKAVLACSELDHYSGSSVHDALDALRFRWVKAVARERLAFLTDIDRVLDRSLPAAAEKILIDQAKVVAHLMDVARSFIDHSGKNMFDWIWERIDVENLAVELGLKCDSRCWKSTQVDLEKLSASWETPDQSVGLTVRGRNNSKEPGHFDPLFEIILPYPKTAA